MSILKRFASLLPAGVQFELRRWRLRRQYRSGAFDAGEPEFALLSELLGPGDWVIDVGANVGHYTSRMSELVGPAGRVLAFEPVPDTFALLATNALLFGTRNVTLINAALSDRVGLVGMSVPCSQDGLPNYYQAQIQSGDADVSVMRVRLDALTFDRKIALIKIDAEGHERSVLEGMRETLERDRPTLIIEAAGTDIHSELKDLGYESHVLAGSPNVIFRPSRV